jgi:hypothetical protein
VKFKKTTYAGISEILKFPDGYTALAVMMDDTDIVADADGKKIVPKGTIVGGAAAPVLTDATQKVQKKNTASVAAHLDTGVVATNNAITFTAKVAGAAGNSIKVQLKDPVGNDKALAVNIAGDVVEVSLATGPAGAITSTAAEVIAAVNAHLYAKTLVVAANTGASTGAAVVEAVAATALEGGTNGSALSAEGVLLNDADVTDGPAPATMLIQAYLTKGKLPEAPVAEAIAALPLIKFIV